MPIRLDGSSLSVEKLVSIARHNEPVELDPAALERIMVCRAMLEEKLAAREVMYGTNTGIGEFSERCSATSRSRSSSASSITTRPGSANRSRWKRSGRR
jgi:histidine ammonia-lyase